MASLVRIKRRQSQEPAEALLLAAKRMKTESGADGGADKGGQIEKSVFNFCGSTDNAENYEVIRDLVKKGKQISRRKSIKETSRIHTKSAPDAAASSSEKKYKVLSAFRNIEDAEVPVKVYDLVPEGEPPAGDDAVTCNGVPLVVEKNTLEEKVQYVYDFYYSDVGTFDDTYIDQLMSVQPYFVNPGEDSDSDNQEDTDDSNDENNWRNDYPSTESDEDDCDEVIVGKMTGMYIDEDGQPSSDEEDFVYAKYGGADEVLDDPYAEYKRRVMKEIYQSFEYSLKEEPDDLSYEEDSDL